VSRTARLKTNTNSCPLTTIDCQRDLFISGDFDRVVYCSQEEYMTISVICILWWLISGECFTHWNFGTQRPYQNYYNNNNNNYYISKKFL